MDAEKPTPAKCKFDACEAWMPNYLALASPLNPMVPSTWRKGLILTDLPTGEAAKKECRDLWDLQQKRSQDEVDLIEEQAPTPNWAVAPVWKAVGFHPSLPLIPALTKLQAAVLDCMRAPIFLLKIDVNRGRPGCCCKESLLPEVLKPMFPLCEENHPGHPSYPSGHAAYAYAMALVLADIRPNCKTALELAARMVATNREIAGVHFASDSKAGQELATHLVTLLLNNPEFKALRDAAEKSWPKLAAPPC
jgi:membrane-associated phospholipid phosphatase